MSPPLAFSVAMATYNGEKFLQEQLDSIAAQTVLPLELIVNDDCSSDRTVEILTEFAERAPFPVMIEVNQRNLGSTANFDRACGRCSGTHIAFCDQDDVWVPQKLEVIAARFRTNPKLGMVFSDATLVDEGLRPLGITMWESLNLPPDIVDIVQSESAAKFILSRPTVTGATMVVSKLALDFARPFPLSHKHMIHDRWVSILTSIGFKIEALSAALVLYRQHRDQQIGAHITEMGQETARLMNNCRLMNNELAEVREILDALSERAIPNRDLVSDYLLEKVVHLRGRITLPQSRFARWPSVFAELISGRYHRHSSGVMSALKDLAL